jgi:replication initiation protein RepC
MNTKTRPAGKLVHKWQVFRAVCTAKARVGVSERALAVLDALLSFHPETTLTGEGLIVFPSNVQLSLRAHGMAPATLRRHLAALVDAGLIIRRDSPNGKRFARKRKDGDVESAFGFDLSPLVARAEEFEAWAEDIRAEDRAIRTLRERITLCRRDIVKMIETGMEEGVPVALARHRAAQWSDVRELYLGMAGRIPRTATRLELAPIADALGELADEILNSLETHIKIKNMSANESQIERHIQSSDPKDLIALELASEDHKGTKTERETASTPPPLRANPIRESYPLQMVLAACPDIIEYSKAGLSNWRDFQATAAVVRSMLGVTPSAWQAAQVALGEIPAAIVVAGILQRGPAVLSAGGYLRELTKKAEQGKFTIGPMLMALLSARRREKKAA